MENNHLLRGFDNWETCARYWHQRTHESQTAHILILKKYNELQRLTEDRDKRIDALTLEVAYYKNQNKKLNEGKEPFVRDVQFVDYPCQICGKYRLDCNCGHGL
jgi:hypothetical protein